MRELANKFLKGEFLKFVVVGAISAVAEYTLYIVLKSSMNYLSANVLAFGFTNILTFILSRRFVFTSTNANKAEEAGLFVVCLAGANLVNHAVLWCLVEVGGIDDRLAKLGAIAITVFWNFFTRKHIVFRNREVVPETERSNASSKNYPAERF